MRTTRISIPLTGLWRTCSRSRVFRGSIFVDKAASTKWSGPPFVFGGGVVGLPASCGYKAWDQAACCGRQFWEMAR